jgi:SAM-dependent methyltransferase
MRLYNDLAWLWPVLSPPADYAAEAGVILDLIHDHHAGPDRPTVLDLGAGAGGLIHHLQRDCDCVAVDLSPAMLAEGRGQNPEVPAVAADLRSLWLGRTFDVVLLHDVLDYMLGESDAAAALATATAHLTPGGLLLACPTYTRDDFEPGDICIDQHELPPPSGTVTSVSRTLADPEQADYYTLDLLVLLQHADGRRELVEDRHACGLLSIQRWLSLMDAAGFDVHVDSATGLPGVAMVAVRC